MGKHKPIYDPSTDCGDYVVAVGCHDLHTTGKKRFQKKYYSHNTRPGSLKEITMDRMMAKLGGGEVLRRAVRGMLPKNRLRDDRMARLKCECACRGRVVEIGWVDVICRFRGPGPSLQGEYHKAGRAREHITITGSTGCVTATVATATTAMTRLVSDLFSTETHFRSIALELEWNWNGYHIVKTIYWKSRDLKRTRQQISDFGAPYSLGDAPFLVTVH